jgi:hypothetical protein
MISISKSKVALSALIAVGLLAAAASVAPRAEDQSPAAQVAERFPLANEMFVSVPMSSFTAAKFAQEQRQATKGDRLSAQNCGQDWPYATEQCQLAADDNAATKVTRVITVERRVGDNTSELVRMPVADLAQR